MITGAPQHPVVDVGALPFRRVLYALEKLGCAEGAIGNGLEDVRADRAAGLPAIDTSKIFDRPQNWCSALTR